MNGYCYSAVKEAAKSMTKFQKARAFYIKKKYVFVMLASHLNLFVKGLEGRSFFQSYVDANLINDVRKKDLN